MQKQQVLFVNYSLHSGGIEKSLVTVLSLFDFEKYDVDLQLFVNEGLFLPRVPKNVRLLPPLFPLSYKKNIRQAMPALLKERRPLLALGRLGVSLAGKARGGVGKRLALMWGVEKQFIPRAKKNYDAAVAFMEGQPIYYVVENVNATRKLGFIHGDYTAMKLCKTADSPFFHQLSALCTVSESCKAALLQNFPEMEQRLHVVYNIISAKLMREMSHEPAAFGDEKTGLRVLTIARLSYQKGLDFALPAVAALKARGLLFHWYIVGMGPEEAALKAQALSLGLADYVTFLGEQPNPYPLLSQCDIYMQPSRFEGKSIAVDEAMVFCRPVLLAEFSTARDQIEDGVTGLIAPMSSDGLEQGLERMLTDGALRKRLIKTLAERDYTNENEIEKLYSLLKGETPC